MSIAVQPVHCPKEKYSDTAQNSGGRSPSCYSDWNLFSSSLSYLWANFAPYKGKIPAHPLGRTCPLDGKKAAPHRASSRSEEHTSELQSRFDLVCRLLLEKKKY